MDADVPQPLHRRQVDLIELEVAFDSVSPKMTYYLDLETGQVILVTGEAWRMVEEAAASAGPIQEDDIVFGAHLEEQPTVSASDWMQDVVADAKRIQADTGARYVAIPPRDPHADYHNMQEFVGTVENDSLRERLWDAIQQRGAFRRFRDILARYPAERERWFEFERECSMQRITDWLAEKGIEPVLEDDYFQATATTDEEPGAEC